MRVIKVLVLAVLAACASAPGVGAVLEGSYRLARIAGNALPAPSPEEDGVTVQGGALVLSADGRYTFELTATAGGDPPETASVAGSYRAEDGELVLRRDGDDAAEPQRVRYSLDDGSLTLWDEEGQTYTFVRQ